MKPLIKRLAMLERARPCSTTRWHRLLRHEHETDTDVVAAHEAQHGPIGSANIVIRVIVGTPATASS